MRARRRDIGDLSTVVRPRRADACRAARPDHRHDTGEIDRALLRWFASRLATVGAEACETEVFDYLIAEALSQLEPGER